MNTEDCMTARAVVRNSFADGSYELELDTRSGCEGCRGVCMWRFLPLVERTRFSGNSSFSPGLPVLVSLPQRYVLLTSVLLYGLPLAALLIGGLLGAAVAGGDDLGTLLGALGVLAASLFLSPRLRRALERATARHLVVRPVR
jgi:positive regulator of sigma E activity